MTTFTVTTLDDENDVGATEAIPLGTGLSLREALALANADADADTIVFSTAPGTLTLISGQLGIATDVTINGDINGDQNADITVSGNDASTVFNVNGGAAPAITASLNGLVIRDGFEPILGGAGIRVAAGDVLIVTNATITENVSTGGGGILNYGSATLINTILSGNDAGVGTGGGILNEGTLDIIGSTLSGNQAGYNGGAIFNYLGAVTLTNSTISGNFTGLLGGGIANRLGSVELTNTTVVGNEADFGGGIFNASALTLTNSTVTGNYASGVLTYSGGGIAHGGSGSYTTLINSIVAGNAAAVGDGDLANTTIPTLTGGNIVGGTRTIDGVTQQSGIALADIFAAIDPVTGGGQLADNGGPVHTVALNASASNPALDAGDDGLAPATDARGFSRDDVAGVGNNGTNFSDLGAFEASHSLVVTTADDVVDASDGEISLREALAYAASNPGADTITFDASLDIVEVDGSALVIASDVTIDGDTDGDGDGDIEIDALDNSRVFDVTAGTSTLQHLVVTGGYAAGENGGGIRVAAGANLTLADVAVVGNDADGDGGGIWNEGTLTLTNAVVASNTAGAGGGGIWNDGTLTLTDTVVADNYAAGGGGIATYAGSTATLINTTLLGNYVDDAAGLGGGILGYAGATLTLVNSTLYGNSAYAAGGIGSIFSDVTLINSTLSGNYASGFGGGIADTGGTLTLINSIVAGNASDTAPELSVGTPPSLIGGNIIGDERSLDGLVQQSDLELTDIFAQVGFNPYTHANSGRLADNSGPVPTIGIKLGGAAQNTGDAAAAVYDDDGNPITPDVPIPTDARGFDRVAGSEIDLGAVELQPGADFIVDTDQDEEFDGGTLLDESNDGGGLSLREALALAAADPLSHDTITFVEALDGGTLTLTQGELVVEGNVTIDGNSDNDAAAITIDGDGGSAVLHVYSGVVALNGLTITGGYADYGAGVSVGSYIFGGNADVTVSNSTISNNSAEYGGGISVDTGSVLRLINSTVSYNQADIGGGIAAAYGATLTVINTTISGNSVAGLYGYGGGIAVAGGASATLVNSTISGNSGIDGGGIYNAGELTLINVTLANNVADRGGGLYMNNCGCGTADVISSTITGNYAGIGGGIYHAAGTLNLTNSIVAGNGSSGASYGPDLLALDTVNYFGVNVFSDIGIGDGEDIHETNLANIFATVATFDPTPVDGDEFDAGVLANNGGLVKTVAIKIGGVAHDNGDAGELPQDSEDLNGNSNTTEDLPFDARGETRVFGAGLDIGAYEINEVNDPPVNSVPDAQALEANHSLAIPGLSVTDPDAFGGSLSTTLSVTHGTLAAAALGGANVTGSGTDTVQVTGTLAAINATLAGGNVVYTPTTDWFDNDQLTMVTNDGGHSGIGGPLTDTDTVAINLHTHLFGTPDNDSFVLDLLPAGDIRIDALGGFGDTLTLDFRLVDATVRYVGNTIIIDGPSRHLVVTGFEQYVFTDGTVDNNDGIRLIDDLFYYSKYHDVWNAHVDADAHFVSFGRDEGRDPNAFFSTVVYRSANPDVAAAGVNPLDHFDAAGWLEGRVPSIHFDPAQYLAANPDVAAAGVNPLRHYLQFGYQEGRQPFAPSELIASNGFDYVWYLDHNPDVAAANIDAFAHFMTVGWTEGRNPNALFDVNGYLATYADVDAANVNPLTHYNQFGWQEGRDPSVGFDTTAYLAAYADVAAAHVNPLTHFLQFGIHEGRSPFADGVWG